MSLEKPIHVTCSLDANYTRFAGVMMTSLFENNQDVKIIMHLMSFKLSDENKSELRDIVNSYHNEILFYDINEDLFKGLPTTKQWNIATYFRLLLPTLIDKQVTRVLYVDCDIVFRGMIRDLYEINLEGNIIGAVEDHVLSPRLGLSYMNGINPDYFYFNAGVLLIDVVAWRANNVTEKCFKYLQKHKPMHLDQDTLNSVLQNSWKHLSYRWNYMADFHSAYFGKDFFDMDMDKTYPYYPVIVHFTGVKPWNHACRSAFKADYYKYQSMTKWKNLIPKHTAKEKLMNILRICCDGLGIKKSIPWKRYDFDF